MNIWKACGIAAEDFDICKIHIRIFMMKIAVGQYFISTYQKSFSQINISLNIYWKWNETLSRIYHFDHHLVVFYVGHESWLVRKASDYSGNSVAVVVAHTHSIEMFNQQQKFHPTFSMLNENALMIAV